MPHNFDNSPTADIILRSGGPMIVEFKAHRTLLSIASVEFETKFSVSQPGDGGSLPICDLPEDATTLEALLRFIYPVEEPHLRSLDELGSVLDAAVKYKLTAVTRLRKMLVQQEFLGEYPLQVYTIAARCGFEEEMKIASGYTLGVDIIDSPPTDVNGLFVVDYRRLLKFHRQRADGAQQVLNDLLPQSVVCPNCRSYVEKWHEEFKRRAKGELALWPKADTICSPNFLAPIVDGIEAEKCCMDSCRRGGGKYQHHLSYLETLRKRIDSLPSSV